jgi:polar amino acid transport system ATP-binding protein
MEAEAAPASARIEVRDLYKSFGPTSVLRGVSLSVSPGEKAVVIGPSGSGKSTLLRCINHLVEPDAGDVFIDGTPIGGHRDSAGKYHRMRESEVNRLRSRMPMVFQRFNLFQNRSVLGNVMEGQITVLRRSRADAESKAVQVLARVGLRHKLKAYPAQLSGGEQQRVGIARALAMDPAIILFDEPTSSLDPELVGEVLDIIDQLAAEGMTMIVVTHEMGFAKHTADTVCFFRDGRVLESGPPAEIFDNPRHQETRSFIRGMER